jgi:predicted dehydrogenase
MSTHTRRAFIKNSSLITGAALAAPYIKASQTEKKLRIAVIGTGGRAFAHYPWMAPEKVVAICDVDTSAFTEVPESYRERGISSAKETFSGARAYTDYRELFESQDDFDAVVINTPDVHHYPAVMRALRAGKAVYCEKPLTFTAWESQQIALETARLKLPTQMGNQGMANPGWRIAHAYYHGGSIGELLEVHCWMNPGIEAEAATWTHTNDQDSDPIPDTLNWDLWCGPAPAKPYQERYFHPAQWRRWVDYGGGALGDFGCHSMNAFFKVLEPSYPTRVELITKSAYNGDTFPAQRMLKWDFPQRGNRPAFTAHWYDGGLKPPRPKELEADRKFWKSGTMIVGSKGTIYIVGHHNTSALLIPESKRKAYGKPKLLVPEARDHFNEFVDAAKGVLQWNAPLSNFTFAAPLAATVQMGNALLRSGLNHLDIDPATGNAIGFRKENNPLGYTPRPGWYI